jgi:predicted transcriptional regulator
MLVDSPVLVSVVQLRNLEFSHPVPTTGESSPVLSPIGSTLSWDAGAIPGDSANQTNRMIILSFITANPGAYLRELTEDLDLSIGVVQYHIWALTKAGEVEDCRIGRFRRFFRVGAYREIERKVVSLLRQETTGQILALLSNGRPLSHMKLANMLGISSQALSWQMARLRRGGFVETRHPAEVSGVEYVLTYESLQIVRGLTRDGTDFTTNPRSDDQRSACAWTAPSLTVEEASGVKQARRRFWY